MIDRSSRRVIAIMRPNRYERESIQICQEAGFEVISAPLIEISDKKDEHFDGFVDRVMKAQSDIVIFTSANGIDYTLHKVSDRDGFISALNRTWTIAIGPKTMEAAKGQGINISFIPQSYSSEGLVEAIKPEVKGKVVDIARSSHGAPVLVDGLKTAGAIVFETQVYEITRPKRNKNQEDLVRNIINEKVDAVVFTSSMMAKNLLELSHELGIRDEVVAALNNEKIVVAAIGHPTAKTLNIYNIQVDIISNKYTFRALINEVRKEFNN